MNAVPPKLCERLYALSNWYSVDMPVIDRRDGRRFPKYTLDYLLWKLEVNADWTHGRFYLEHCGQDGQYQWIATYNSFNPDFPCLSASKPQHAVAKLAIELFNQGILHKEGA